MLHFSAGVRRDSPSALEWRELLCGGAPSSASAAAATAFGAFARGALRANVTLANDGARALALFSQADGRAPTALLTLAPQAEATLSVALGVFVLAYDAAAPGASRAAVAADGGEGRDAIRHDGGGAPPIEQDCLLAEYVYARPMSTSRC